LNHSSREVAGNHLGGKEKYRSFSLNIYLEYIDFTPRKFNMEPENQPLEKKIPFGNHHFQVPC